MFVLILCNTVVSNNLFRGKIYGTRQASEEMVC